MVGKLGVRQRQVLQIMARSGNRWPKNWKVRHDTEGQALTALIRRGLVESRENPILTPSGVTIAQSMD